MTTASANPQKLEEAAAAVPAEIKNALEQAVTYGGLASKIQQFAQGTQDPVRVDVKAAEALLGALATARSTGNELDTRLVRIAGEFRRAGGDSPVPWGWQGPVAPGAPASSPDANTRYMDDAALQAGLNQWGLNQGPELRQRDDGKAEMMGPDGNWYLVAGSPPQGASPLGTNEGTVDFTNPEALLYMFAAGFIGFGGYKTNPTSHAPREAYDHIRLGPNGVPIVGPNAGDYSQPLPRPGVGGLAGPGHVNQPFRAPTTGDERPTPPWRPSENGFPPLRPGEVVMRGHTVTTGPRWEPPPTGIRQPLESRGGRIASAAVLANALAEAAKHADAWNKNMFRTRTTFYVDPRTGQRVAVVDVASITYEEQDHDGDPATEPRRYVVVRWGRLNTEQLGQPTVVAHPASPETFSQAGESRFPLGAVD